MRKIIITLLLICTAIGVSAKFRWGPSVGVNFSDYYWKQDLVESQMLPGFSAGLMAEVMIPGIGFGFDFGLRYTMRGGKVHFDQQHIWAVDGIGTTNLYFHTLQIPLNLRFKYTRLNGVEQYVAPIVFAGPLFNFNLSHKDCPAVENPAGSVGIQVGIGAELWRRLQITGGYMWGLTYDVRTIKLDNFSARTQGWFIDFAFLIGK